MGLGRMAEVEEVLGTIRLILGRRGDLAGKKVVVSAGPTWEPIDTVRQITNPSSGKMGFAVAEAARDRGARVVLVTGPTSLPPPAGGGAGRGAGRPALEMKAAGEAAVTGADALIMTAAVADYRPAAPITHKLKKEAEV